MSLWKRFVRPDGDLQRPCELPSVVSSSLCSINTRKEKKSKEREGASRASRECLFSPSVALNNPLKGSGDVYRSFAEWTLVFCLTFFHGNLDQIQISKSKCFGWASVVLPVSDVTLSTSGGKIVSHETIRTFKSSKRASRLESLLTAGSCLQLAGAPFLKFKEKTGWCEGTIADQVIRKRMQKRTKHFLWQRSYIQTSCSPYWCRTNKRQTSFVLLLLNESEIQGQFFFYLTWTNGLLVFCV